MAQCRKCKQDIDPTAKFCPRCGEKNPTQVKKISLPAVGCLVIIGLAVIGSLSSRSSSDDSSSSVSPMASAPARVQSTDQDASSASGPRLTRSGYFACASYEQFDEFTKYLVDQDKEAAAQLLVTGECSELKAGVPVEIVDTKILSGAVRIRPRGSRASVWTNIEAISR
jgi:hypothetical protein